MSIHPDPNLNRLNVLGEPLASCCYSPITGYFRNGFCHTAPSDLGQHTICVEMTSEFLNFSQRVGNDLITPVPEVTSEIVSALVTVSEGRNAAKSS